MFVDYKDFNIANLFIEKSPSSGTKLLLNYAYSAEDCAREVYQPLVIKSPDGLSHWGISDYQGDQKFRLEIKEAGGLCNSKFLRMFDLIEEKLQRYLLENSEKLLGCVKTKDEIEAMLLKCIARNKNGNIKLTLKVPTTHNGSRFAFALKNDKMETIFQHGSTESPSFILTRDTHLTAVFRLDTVFLYADRIVILKQLQEGKVMPQNISCFEADIATDEEEEEGEVEFGINPLHQSQKY